MRRDRRMILCRLRSSDGEPVDANPALLSKLRNVAALRGLVLAEHAIVNGGLSLGLFWDSRFDGAEHIELAAAGFRDLAAHETGLIAELDETTVSPSLIYL